MWSAFTTMWGKLRLEVELHFGSGIWQPTMHATDAESHLQCHRPYFGECKIWNVLLLRSSSFVLRKIIHFCEGEMEGPRIVLPTGSLTHRFFGVRKVDPPKLALATGIGRFRDPFFGRKKVDFLEKSCKKWSVTFTFGKGCKNHTVSNWRWWRHGSKLASNESIFVQPTRASRPCRARCI